MSAIGSTASLVPAFRLTQAPHFESTKEKSLLQLDWKQRFLFSKKLNSWGEFKARDGSIVFPFDQFKFFHQLIQKLEARGLSVLHSYLIGSQMMDVLLNKERTHRDKDFLVILESGQNAHLVKEIFLQFLLEFSGIRGHHLPSGKVQFNLHNSTSVLLEKPEDLFTLGALDALGAYGNLMLVTLPIVGCQLDITFAWDLELSCNSSANCFQGDALPYFRDPNGYERLYSDEERCFVHGADGYNCSEGLTLFLKGFFYCQPQMAAKLRKGLQNYIHTVTTGLCPIDFSIEQTFLEKWLVDYPSTGRRHTFLLELRKHFLKHYGDCHFSTVAYLLNLLTFFSNKEFENKQEWLGQLQEFSHSWLPSLGDLHTLLFWKYVKNITAARIDPHQGQQASFPPRFRIPLPHSALLNTAPWDETLTLLTNPQPPNLPAHFRQFFKLAKVKQEILAALAKVPTPENSVARLLVAIAKLDLAKFIMEFARALTKLEAQQITQLVQLLKLQIPDLAISIASPLHFVQSAFHSGHTEAARGALFAILPAAPSLEEQEIIFSIATDFDSWKILYEKNPAIVLTYLKKLPPSDILLNKIAALAPPSSDWPVTWIEFIEQQPSQLTQFLKTATFANLHLAVAQRLLKNPGTAEVASHFLEIHYPAEFQAVVTTLAPSKKLLHKIAKSSFSVSDWPLSWVDFMVQNPGELGLFLGCDTFGKKMHLRVVSRLLQYGEHFLTTWKEACLHGCLPDEIKEMNGHLKGAQEATIAVLLNGLFSLFEIDRDSATYWTRVIFKALPWNTLEKSPSLLVNSWKLLQLASRRALRTPPLLSQEIALYLKMIFKENGDLLTTLAALLKEKTLTIYHRTDLVTDLFAFSKYLYPSYAVAASKLFAAHFFHLVLSFFQDPLFISQRRILFQQLSTFAGDLIPMPQLMAVMNKRFAECIPALAHDLIQAPETYKHLIHWLLDQQIELPIAKQVLAVEAKTMQPTQLFPEDLPRLMDSVLELSEAVLVEALKLPTAGERALRFLKKQTAPFAPLPLFETWTISVPDLILALSLAIELKRLGSITILAAVLSRKATFTAHHLPLLEQVGDGSLVWDSVSASFHDKNISFQIQVASLCLKLNHHVGSKVLEKIQEHFAKQLTKNLPLLPLLELTKVEFIPLTPLWEALKPHVQESKILKAFIQRLENSADLKLNFQLLAEACQALKPSELKAAPAEFFKKQLDRIKKQAPPLSLIEFLEILTPLIRIKNIADYLPLNLWIQALDWVQQQVETKKEDLQMKQLVLRLVKTLRLSSVWSPEIRYCLFLLVERVELVQCEEIATTAIWVEIKYLLVQPPLLRSFLTRLKKSTDYLVDFNLLAGLPLSVPISDLQDVFQHKIEQIKQQSFELFWEIVRPLIKGDIGELIPVKMWNQLFEISFKEAEDKLSRQKFLVELLLAFATSSFWSEDALLYIARQFQASLDQLSDPAKAIWGELTLQAKRIMITPQKQQELGKIIFQTLEVLRKEANVVLSPEVVEGFAWSQTPLLTKEERLHSYQQKLTNPTANFQPIWLAEWMNLGEADWTLEEFKTLAAFLPQILAAGYHSLALSAHFILIFEFGRALSNRFKDTANGATVLQFHQISLAQYNQYAKEQQVASSAEEPSEFEFISQINSFILRKENIPPTITDHQRISILNAQKTKETLIYKILCIHATVLDEYQLHSAKKMELHPPTLARELFELVKSHNFYSYFDRNYMSLFLKELYSSFAKGTQEEILYLGKELTTQLQQTDLFATLSPPQKAQLFSNFINDMILCRGAEAMLKIQVAKAMLSFTRLVLETPEWEINFTMGCVQLVYLLLIRAFNHFQEFEAAFEVAESLVPSLWKKFHLTPLAYQHEVAAAKVQKQPDAAFQEQMYTLIEQTAREKEVEKAVDAALEISTLRKRAHALQKEMNLYKKTYVLMR